MQKQNTSWGKVASWYDKIVGNTGHYYHEHVIFPQLKKILIPKNGDKILDIGCGQGVYAKLLSPSISYVGIDLAKELIAKARLADRSRSHEYYVADATKPLPVAESSFDYALSILALQNMRDPQAALLNMVKALKPGGLLIFVLNHPAFRIPRQSSWGIDEASKLEYRRINRYLTPLEIPINAHPGQKNSPVTWSYHHPISYYVQSITNAGCVVTGLEEWVSDKESEGKAKKMENRARAEFPLFLTIVAKKI